MSHFICYSTYLTKSFSKKKAKLRLRVLLQSFDRLGQSALDHSEDKFLVQSCVVDDKFAKDYAEEKFKAGDVGSAVESSKIGKGHT